MKNRVAAVSVLSEISVVEESIHEAKMTVVEESMIWGLGVV